MKILVTYYSQTGNTKLVAETIHASLMKKAETTLETIENLSIDELNDYNLVFIGSPCHNTDLAKPVKEFLASLPNKPSYIMAGFYTHSCYPKNTDEKAAQLIEKFVGKCDSTFEDIRIDKEIDFIGHYRCTGKPSKETEEFIQKKVITDPKDFEDYQKSVQSHPDKKDLKHAKKFALTVFKEVQKMIK